MSVLTEGAYSAEFVLSEANGFRSREVVTIASGNNLGAGTVLGKITASGKYAGYDDGLVDGTEVAVAVLYADCDASTADQEAVVIFRDAEVSDAKLVWVDEVNDKAAGLVDLAAVGIVSRS